MADGVEKSEVAKKEEEILSFWKERDIFQKTLDKKAPKGEFVFYDGPPFATGLPHSGSLLSSVSKDVIPRYKTMRGYRVRRRWGWDTHGLPIESAVEKKLGLKNKKEILTIGIEKFNETARAMVLEYVQDWKRYVERVGRFVDFDNSYKTMDNSFMESVWWGLKEIHKKGRLYEGRKVLLYCPHCETPLAKAEIAMDNTYQDVTEEAVTVKFKIKNPAKYGLPEHTYFLAWTTTPWTLPGNVALAVGPEISYGLFEKGGENFLVAEERAVALRLNSSLEEDALKNNENSAVRWTKKGKELVGIEYEPLYEIVKAVAHKGKKWQVLSADFVHTEEGTGIVHTAVIYGEDDFALGQKEALPMVQILNANATYNEDAPEFLRGQYIKKAEVLIKEDLEKRGLLFAKAPNTHAYPHCYRCGTPLIYNAVSSWFINIQAVKDRLLKENEKIRWTPEHLKYGRFRHIIETAPDWTISRNRFWASPLPIWKNKSGAVTVIGSLAELKEHTRKSGNTYFIMRHGEAESNVREVMSTDFEKQKENHLTEKGRAHTRAALEHFKKTHKIDSIVTSPFTRALETAALAAEVLGVSPTAIHADERLREIAAGTYDGQPVQEYHDFFSTSQERFRKAPQGGETFSDVRRRVGSLLYELEETRQGKRILLVSHGDPLWMVSFTAAGEEVAAMDTFGEIGLAEIRTVPFIPLPHNADYELDYHLPYIDQITLIDKDGEALTRTPEVVDCWVESGAMPFAEWHYPFENAHVFKKRAPGDFVSEYIAQTRAWFYYMHVMSVELFDERAFKNVLTTGTILAAGGAKVSKSKKNYTDPYLLFDAYGADAFRYYLMASVVMQAEDLTFRDADVKEAHARVINMLRNVLAFYTLVHEDADGTSEHRPHVLDRWILVRLARVTQEITEAFERYDIVHATRPIRDFVDDLSTWYVRRSRERMKGGDAADAQAARATLQTVIFEFSKIIAPTIPFIAEELFAAVKGAHDPESVHLAAWPEVSLGERAARRLRQSADTALLSNMARVRALASDALQLRQKAGIKVRQPLHKLSIPDRLPPEFLAVLAEEVNVKHIRTGAATVELDTVLTPELILEGDVRDFMRTFAEARKSLGLVQKDTVRLSVSKEGRTLFSEGAFPGVSTIAYDATDDASYRVELSFGTVHFTIIPDAA